MNQVPTWMIACRSQELTTKPLALMIAGNPVALFRNARGIPSAFVDICPHRGAPLSQGEVIQGQLTCPYHGWRFDERGICSLIPHLPKAAGTPGFKAQTYATMEQQGYIWIYSALNTPPTSRPFEFATESSGNLSFFQDLESDLKNIIENQLDVSHTSTLHRGLFRKNAAIPQRIRVRKRVDLTSIEVEYVGEKGISGTIGKLFGLSAETDLKHKDTLLRPWITEVCYQHGHYEIKIQSALTPVSEHRTRVYTQVCYRLPFFVRFLKPILLMFVKKILAQDKNLLESQTRTLKNMENFHPVKGPLDFLQPELDTLLKGKPLASQEQEFLLEL